jgi:hypothetical protein
LSQAALDDGDLELPVALLQPLCELEPDIAAPHDGDPLPRRFHGAGHPPPDVRQRPGRSHHHGFVTLRNFAAAARDEERVAALDRDDQ